jgi:hypothetical protein
LVTRSAALELLDLAGLLFAALAVAAPVPSAATSLARIWRVWPAPD